MPSASSPASSGVSMTTVFLFFAVATAGVTEGTLTHIPITHNSAGSIGAWGPIDVWACGWGCTSPQTHAHGIQVMTGLKPNQWYLSQGDPIIPSGSSSAIVVATGTIEPVLFQTVASLTKDDGPWVNYHLAGNNATGPFSYRYVKSTVPPTAGYTFAHMFPNVGPVRVTIEGKVVVRNLPFGTVSELVPLNQPSSVYPDVQVFEESTNLLLVSTKAFADTGSALSVTISPNEVGCPVITELICGCCVQNCSGATTTSPLHSDSDVPRDTRQLFTQRELPVLATAVRRSDGTALPCHAVSYYLASTPILKGGVTADLYAAPLSSPTPSSGRLIASGLRPLFNPIGGDAEPLQETDVLFLVPNGTKSPILAQGQVKITKKDGNLLVVIAGVPGSPAPYSPQVFKYNIVVNDAPSNNECEYYFGHWLSGVAKVDVSFGGAAPAITGVRYGQIAPPFAAPRTLLGITVTDSSTGKVIFSQALGACFLQRVLLTLEPDANNNPKGGEFPF